jgi:hypothetical protein
VLTGIEAAGEADHADALVGDEIVAEHGAVAGDALEDAGGQSGLR